MLEWNDKFSVGISRIDEEHKKLFGILNKAILAKGHNDDPEELREVLRKMINYAIAHFKTEETYMKEFNFPEYQDHKKEHRDFYIETITYLDKFTKSGSQIANDKLEYLKWWLVNHIQVTDRKFIDCFKKNGLK